MSYEQRRLSMLPALLLMLMVAASLAFLQFTPVKSYNNEQLEASLQTIWARSEMSSSSNCRLDWPNGTDMASIQLTYNTQANEYLGLGMRYHEVYGLDGEILGVDWREQWLIGLRLSAHGQPLFFPTQVTSSTVFTSLPAAAYNQTSNRYLVVASVAVFNQPDNIQSSNVEAYVLEADLAPKRKVLLDAAEGYQPWVAYNSDDDEFLIVWHDVVGLSVGPTLPPTKGLYIQRVQGNGIRFPDEGARLLIPQTLARKDLTGLKVVYNPRDREYLLIWTQRSSTPGLYSLRLSRTGVAIGEPIRLTPSIAVPYAPHLVYNSTDNQYLVVWADMRGGEGGLADVYGRVVTSDNVPRGDEFIIRGTSEYEVPTSLVYNPVHHEYLIAWDASEKQAVMDTDIKTTMQRVSPAGELVDGPVETVGGVFSLGVSRVQGNYLVLERFGFYPKAWGSEEPCPTTPTPSPTRFLSSPSPTPRVLQQRGILVAKQQEPWGAVQWFITRDDEPNSTLFDALFTRQSRLDDHLGQADIGAKVWVTVHEQTWGMNPVSGPSFDYPIEFAAVLAPAHTATLEPSVTTPTVTATQPVQTTTTPTPSATLSPTPTGAPPGATLTPTATATTPTATPTATGVVPTTVTPTVTPTATGTGMSYHLYLPLLQRRDEP